MTEMMRFNKGKIDLTHLSWVSQSIESLIFMFGEYKYKRDNWKNGKATQEETLLNLMQSAKRHIMKYEAGEWLDDESGMPHIGHAVWNLNRMLDFFYYKDKGKKMFHGGLLTPLPEVPMPKEEADDPFN